MKISPVTGPGAVQDLSTPEHVRTQRAVDAFKKGQPLKAAQAPTQGQLQEYPVADANNISAEELSAIHTQPTESLEEPDNTAIPEDTPVEEKPKEDPALSRQFAQLARQERALRAKQQQLDQAHKARLSELEAREKALEGKSSFNPDEYISKARLRQNALDVLEAEGITNYEQLTERAVSRVPVDPVLQATIDKLNAKIAEMEAKTSTVEKSWQDQQVNARAAAERQIEQDAIALIKNNPEEYEAISKTGTVKQIKKLIVDTFDKDGRLMTVEEAATEVENYLVEENYRMATNIDKIKKRMAQANASSGNSDVKTQAQNKQTQGMKTLTNAASSSRQLSAKERAILAFKGELKS